MIIEKNIPIPPTRRDESEFSKVIQSAEFGIGDSVLVTVKNQAALSSRLFNARKRTGRKYSVRRQESPNTFRVWRVL